MAEKIVMPKAGMAMDSGVIVRWLKDVGEMVTYGEPLLEIETDKTTMQVESLGSGYLLKTLYDAGDVVPVVSTIGYLGEKDEALPEEMPLVAAKSAQNVSTEKTKTEKAHAEMIPATPLARKLARARGIQLDTLYSGDPLRVKDIQTQTTPKITPLAKRLAEQEGLNISDLRGSGHNGKVYSRDLPAVAATDSTISHTAMRRTIARRMLQSHQEIPPVTLNTEADVTALSSLRKSINNSASIKISFNDLVIKACAIALGEFPNINSSYAEEGVIRKSAINIGMAVALDDGLIVPVIRNADALSLRGISEEAKRLAGKARDGGLSPEEYEGGTFTVSNLGMFGITSFTPIINLPEACILGVCAITERVVLAKNNNPEARQFMGLSLTFDHRCIDGAGGAKFLQRIVGLLQNPFDIIL